MSVGNSNRIDNLDRIQNLTDKTGKTVQDLVKDAKDLNDAIQSIVDVLEECQDYTDSGKTLFEQYIKDLPGVQQNFQDIVKYWDQITNSAKENLSTTSMYIGGLNDVYSILRNITEEVQRPRSIITEQINLFKQSRDYAIRIVDSLKIQGGLESSNLTRNVRKTQEQLYLYSLKEQELGLDKMTVGQREAYAESERKAAAAAETSYRLHLLAKDLSRDQLDILKQQVDQHKLNAEYASVATRRVFEANRDNALEIRNLARQEKKSHFIPSILGDISKKAGHPEFNEYLESYDQSLISKQLIKKNADEKLKFIRQDNANTLKYDQDRVDSARDLATKAIGRVGGVTNALEANLAGETFSSKKARLTTRDESGRIRGLSGRFLTDKQAALELSTLLALEKARKEAVQANINAQNSLSEALKNQTEHLQETTELEKAALEEQNRAEQDLKNTRKSQLTLIKEGLTTYLRGLTVAGVAVSLATKLWKAFKDVDKAASDVQHSVGTWAGGIAGANIGLASSVDTLKVVQSLVDEFSINPVRVFSPDELGQIANAKNLLGLTDQQAARLGATSKLAGQGAREFKNNLEASIGTANRLSHAAGQPIVAGGKALKEALNTSDAIALSMGNNATKIGAAAQAAVSLGMSLKDIEGISRSLIDFESSISAEMEAQLLTGRELNLAKAREYALDNNLEGVVRELQKQDMNGAEYGRMNLIQQESFAKSLGMTRDQYAKMLVQQALSGTMSEKQARLALGDNVYEAMSATERWSKSVEKLRQSFAPILNILGGALSLISSVLQPFAFIFGKIGQAVAWIGNELNKISPFLKWTLDVVLVGILAKVLSIGKAVKGIGITGLVTKLGTGVRVLAAGPEKLARARHLRSIGAFKLDPTAGSGAPKSGSKIINRISSLFKKTPKLVEGEAAAKSSSSLGKAFSGIGKKMPQILMGALAIGIVAAAMIPLAKALQMMSGVKTKDVGNLILALTGVTAVVAVLGAAFSGPQMAFLVLGAAAIGTVGLAVLALGKGLKELQGINIKQTLTDISEGINKINIKAGVGKEFKKIGTGFKKIAAAGANLSLAASSVSTLTLAIKDLNEQLGTEKNNLDQLSKLNKVTFKHSGKVENKTILEETETISNIYAEVKSGFDRTVNELRQIKNIVNSFENTQDLQRNMNVAIGTA